MKLLLDTHIWLWSLLEPSRLTRRVSRELESEANELWLSPISIWELIVLHQKKRIVLETDLEEWIESARGQVPFLEAPLTYDIALATKSLRLQHKDPADRFLVATAKILRLTFVTADDRILKCKDVTFLPNR